MYLPVEDMNNILILITFNDQNYQTFYSTVFPSMFLKDTSNSKLSCFQLFHLSEFSMTQMETL